MVVAGIYRKTDVPEWYFDVAIYCNKYGDLNSSFKKSPPCGGGGLFIDSRCSRLL